MPCIDLFVCVLQCSMNFGAQDVALKENVSKVCRLLVNMHFRKFWKNHPYFTGEIVVCVICGFQCCYNASVWNHLRAFYFSQGSSLAKQILTWYRLLISRAGLPKKMKNQSQLLKAVCICPVRFLSPKNAWLDVFLYSPRKEPRAIWFHPFFNGRIVICVFQGH